MATISESSETHKNVICPYCNKAYVQIITTTWEYDHMGPLGKDIMVSPRVCPHCNDKGINNVKLKKWIPGGEII